ncbi:MAG: hypothetical protein ABEJ08_00350 [Halobacteriaceae archaeon]
MSVPERLSGPVRDVVESNRWRRALGVLVVGGTIATTVLEAISPLTATGVLVVFAFLYMETLESQVLDFDDTLRDFRNEILEIEVLERGADDKRFETVIDEANPEEVVLVDYSSERGRRVVRTAMEEDAEVYLFMKLPATVSTPGAGDWTGERGAPINERQANKIVDQLTRHHREYDEPERLHVYLYRANASVRARLIDDSHVAVGWYRFGTKNVTGFGRGVGIHGVNNPMLLLPSGHPEHAEFDGWLREEVLPDLLRDSVTLWELLSEGGRECPDRLARWYDREYDRDQKVAFVRAVSQAPENPPFELPDAGPTYCPDDATEGLASDADGAAQAPEDAASPDEDAA